MKLIDAILSVWYIWIWFLGGFLEWCAEAANVGIGAMHRRSKLRHKRKMAELRLQLQIEQERSGVAQLPQPGECVHRNSVPVMEADELGNGKVVAWLCRSCDEQLPATWAVRAEDL